MIELQDIQTHLERQYDAWSRVLYPSGRSKQAARLVVEEGEHSSGYRWGEDEIVIFVPNGNFEDFEGRLGKIITTPDIFQLTASEIELLHEMMHERQSKMTPSASCEGKRLFRAHGSRFAGPGHDERFYTAIADSAACLGLTADELVMRL